MIVAMVTSRGRMAPCFAGAELWIVPDNVDLSRAQFVSTRGWHPLAWGRELMQRDVAVLLCAGIDQATWAGVRGHGIDAVPTAIGNLETVLSAWRDGNLQPPHMWPAFPVGTGGRRRRGRFRGGA